MMVLLCYCSWVAWILPATMIGYNFHNGWIGLASYIAAFIIQFWICVIANFAKEIMKNTYKNRGK
ncbi:hypothetical protein [Pediococcus pentosaceus]|uniref:hypothetical protein n=1 Tax=Pediococcus pentosaceus TaxID=1255 RepID=UPI0011B675A8|nr:hypothetical protein [Pediococcus pentosaceus]QDZ69529.1 hypothetical protein PSL001_00790 [Pediococcus pentosaceus]